MLSRMLHRMLLAGALAGLLVACSAAGARTHRATPPPRPPPPRVLLLGDSIMDQEGSAAAFLLRQLGFDAEAEGIWGSGLFTREQYDFGHSITTPPRPGAKTWDWLIEGPRAEARLRPDLVVVSMNHNYWPPYPRDAHGVEITDLHTPAARRMMETQARLFIALLRAHGARVAFVDPVPAPDSTDPAADPIWAAYLPVLRAEHIPIIDIRPALSNARGARVETAADCSGRPELLRPPPVSLHLTRLGAGRAGALLARAIAARFGRSLDGETAPGERSVVVVPTRRGDGYWLVNCDGSVTHFGSAPPVAGLSARGHLPIVGAVAATGGGLWLVSRDGTIEPTGGAPALTFTGRPQAALVAAAGTADGEGIVAATAAGEVVAAGTARLAGGAQGLFDRVVAVAARPSGDGYWLVTNRGAVLAFGSAETHGAVEHLAPLTVVAGIAPTASGNGYWIVTSDGTTRAFGDAAIGLLDAGARVRGPGAWKPPAAVVGVTARATGGYWLFTENGAVHGFDGAPAWGGSNNLALFTA